MLIEKTSSRSIRCCGPDGVGGESRDHGGRVCIADACAAWRWQVRFDYDRTFGGMSVYPPPEPKRVQSETHGYCGLAGHVS